MKTLLIPKLIKIATPAINNNSERFSFGIFAAFDLSKIINPKPPREKRNEAANPSIMYCPFTLKNNAIVHTDKLTD